MIDVSSEPDNDARVAAVVNRAPEAILTLSADAFVDGFNLAAQALFGLSPMWRTGTVAAEALVPPWGRPRFRCCLAEVPRDGPEEPYGRRWEMPMLRGDGRLFPALVAAISIPRPDGAWSIACYIRDNTLEKRAKAALLVTQWELQELAGRIEAAREEERTRIARELHDELGQQLTAIRIELSRIEARARASEHLEPDLARRLETVSELVKGTIAVVRRVATELRPGVLDHLGLAEAIRWQAREFADRFGIQVSVRCSGVDPPAGSATVTALFRTFQELLTNIARHSGARRVRVHLREAGGTATLRVTDDGCGLRGEASGAPGSFGLVGIRERTSLLGGQFRIDSARDHGTVAIVSLPHQAARAP